MEERRVYRVSCSNCRKRKVRCDRTAPCQNCQKRGEDCVFPEKFRSLRIDYDDTVAPLEAELRRLRHENMVLKTLPRVSKFSLCELSKFFAEKQLATEPVLSRDAAQLYRFVKTPLSEVTLPQLRSTDNLILIGDLCRSFFASRQYYENFIPQREVNSFLLNYPDSLKQENRCGLLFLITTICIAAIRELPDSDPLFGTDGDYFEWLSLLYTKFFFLKKLTVPSCIFRKSALVLAVEDYYFQNEPDMALALFYELASTFDRNLIDARTAELMNKMQFLGGKAKVAAVRADIEVAVWLAASRLASQLGLVLMRNMTDMFPASPLSKFADIRLAYNLGLAELTKVSVKAVIDIEMGSDFYEKDAMLDLEQSWEHELTVYESLINGDDIQKRETIRNLQRMSGDFLPENGIVSLCSRTEMISDTLVGYVAKAMLSVAYVFICDSALSETLDALIKALDCISVLSSSATTRIRACYPFVDMAVRKTLTTFYTVLHLDAGFLVAHHDKMLQVRRKFLMLHDEDHIYTQLNMVKLSEEIASVTFKYEQKAVKASSVGMVEAKLNNRLGDAEVLLSTSLTDTSTGEKTR